MSDTPNVTESPVVEAQAETPPAPETTESKPEVSVEDQVLAEIAASKTTTETVKHPPPPPAKEVKPPSRIDGMKSPDERAEYFKAVRNLRWSGLTPDAIETLPIDKVLAAGKNAAQRRAEIDRGLSKREAKADSRRADAPPPDNRPGNRNRTPAPEPEYDDRTSEDSDPVDDLLDDGPPEQPPQRRNAEAERYRQEAFESREKLNAALIQSAIRSAETDFPQIKTEGHLSRLAARMEYLDPDLAALNSGDAGEVSDLFRQACLIEYGDQLLHQSRAATREAADLIRNGQPTSGGARGKTAKTLTEDELEDATLAALSASGWNKQAADRELNRTIGG